MAMPFGNPEVTTAYEECFRKAAEDAGFGLRILTEAQGAGLIDDQLRVAIRAAKFLVADVSTGNRGAYWEAGFAEGLGRPVIYTCREDVLKDKTHEHHPHFDTNHMNTVTWAPDKLEDARRRLTATIRNTFPTEALMPID
jgi:nucleoside 2-deoxyribosyltransferase